MSTFLLLFAQDFAFALMGIIIELFETLFGGALGMSS